MIVEVVVEETTLSPWAYSFRPLGGLHGKVSVKAVDARGVTHAADWTELRDLDNEVLLDLDVHLREDWTYPVRIMVDRAKTQPAPDEDSAP